MNGGMSKIVRNLASGYGVSERGVKKLVLSIPRPMRQYNVINALIQNAYQNYQIKQSALR